MTSQLVLALCFAVLGVAHSVLGEVGVLKPLFAASWNVETPRWAVERILRFAWHLTTIAWLGVAMIALDVTPLPVIGLTAIISAAVVFVMLRGHLAWPLFLLAGLAAFHGAGWLTQAFYRLAASLAAVGLALAALVHVYWALGGRRGFDMATPETKSGFVPGPWLTAAVAMALAGFGALVTMTAFEAGPSVLRYTVMAGVGVFTVRAIGDGKVAGFTKADHTSPFGQADDRYFTPIVVFLALGATASLLV